MKRALAIILLGVLVGLSGYFCLYKLRTSRLSHSMPNSELAWLKTEFNLSDPEFARIQELHQAYLPECARLCALLASANSDLNDLVMKTNKVTPEISAKLAEIGRIRQECQSRMLTHFYAVSQAMPPEQGRRYLEQMQMLTSLSNMRDHSVSEHQGHAHRL